jgi:hypothetical protein
VRYTEHESFRRFSLTLPLVATNGIGGYRVRPSRQHRRPEAAELNYDPQQIFGFLHDEIVLRA